MRRIEACVWAACATVLFSNGCASTLPPTVFQPKDAPGVQSFFRNGAAIAAIHSDSVFALAQVQPTTVTPGGTPYVRLWLLVENHSSRPLLLEPLTCARLRIESMGTVQKDSWGVSGPFKGKPIELDPSPPTKILASISDAQAASAILSSIGAVLEASAQKPTTATTTTAGATYTTTFNDQDQKRQAILDRRRSAIASTDAWHEAYKRSLNVGILRRNTLFPGESVNGFIYFKVPMVTQPRQMDRRYVVTLTVGDEDAVAVFEPIEGE